MIKRIRFWVHVLRSCLNAYEEAVNEFGINPLIDARNKRKPSKVDVSTKEAK